MIVLGTEPRRARPDSCECRPGKDTEITPKPSQAFRVVRNRHDSRQVFSQGIGIRDALQPEGDDAKSRQHDWKAGTAAIVTMRGRRNLFTGNCPVSGSFPRIRAQK